MTRPPALARLVLATTALVTAAAHPSSAQADAKVTAKRMWFAEQGKQLVVHTSFTELFDANAYGALSSGFTTTVVLRAYVFRQGTAEPVALSIATFHLVYDLWDEEYSVRIEDARGRRNAKFTSQADALKAITEVAELPVAQLSQIAIGPHYHLAMLVELNPVGQERLAEMRRWLTKRAGSTSIASSASMFGSFVSVFVNPKLQQADNALRLKSQPFFRVAE